MAKTFDGHRVSNPWWRVLTAARADGVRFVLNSGRRTLAEQWRLYRNPPRDSNGRPVPVAFPSPNAPHIMVGRYAHAIDVNALDGGETRLQAWLEKHGVDVSNPVIGEAWHMVVPERQLVALAKRLKHGRAHPVRQPAASRKLSGKGLDLIARFEGLRLTAYKPVAAERWYTIGYGHTGPDITKGMTITRARARELLRQDARGAQDAVRSAVRVPLSQGEYDALVSFTFNVGGGALASSTLLRELNAGHRKAAADQFKRWNRGADGRPLLGLTRRRRAERRMFLRVPR